MAGCDSQQVGDATEISTTPEKVPAPPWLLVAISGPCLRYLHCQPSFIGGLIAAGFVYQRDVPFGALRKQATQYRTPAKISRFQDGHRG